MKLWSRKATANKELDKAEPDDPYYRGYKTGAYFVMRLQLYILATFIAMLLICILIRQVI